MTTALVVAVPVALLAAAEFPAAAVGLCGVGVLTAVTVYAARRRTESASTADGDRDRNRGGSDSGVADPDADPPAEGSAGRESHPCRTVDRDAGRGPSLDARTGSVAGRVCRRPDSD